MAAKPPQGLDKSIDEKTHFLDFRDLVSKRRHEEPITVWIVCVGFLIWFNFINKGLVSHRRTLGSANSKTVTLLFLSIYLPHGARGMVLEWKSRNCFSSLKSLHGFLLPQEKRQDP